MHKAPLDLDVIIARETTAKVGVLALGKRRQAPFGGTRYTRLIRGILGVSSCSVERISAFVTAVIAGKLGNWLKKALLRD
ncbi:MAG: hypothetical protein LAP86_02105 [Acidobacteriia bacterium]|nr:hypothetical protein [Terriglobia bacterium]